MWILLLFPLFSFADPLLSEVLSVRQQIAEHCREWNSVRGNCPVLLARVKTAQVEFAEVVALGDGEPRSGKNTPSTNRITISRSFWRQAVRMPTLRIGFLVHEYFGLLGLETTDDYHLTLKLVNELRGLLISGNARANFLRVLPTVDSTPIPGCVNLGGQWKYKSGPEDSSRIGIGIQINQTGCEKVELRNIRFKNRGATPSWGLEELAVTILVGGTRTRYENSLLNLGAAFQARKDYEARFVEKSLVENRRDFDNSLCEIWNERFTLVNPNRLDRVAIAQCRDGRRTENRDTYLRIRP